MTAVNEKCKEWKFNIFLKHTQDAYTYFAKLPLWIAMLNHFECIVLGKLMPEGWSTILFKALEQPYSHQGISVKDLNSCSTRDARWTLEGPNEKNLKINPIYLWSFSSPLAFLSYAWLSSLDLTAKCLMRVCLWKGLKEVQARGLGFESGGKLQGSSRDYLITEHLDLNRYLYFFSNRTNPC